MANRTSDPISSGMANVVFIHTNAQQMMGALVARHALKRHSATPRAFDVRICRREAFPVFDRYEGRKFLRAGGWRVWRNADLQSFTPVRFSAPMEMGYSGRAIVLDPDIFAIGDIMELFERNMAGAAVLARPRPGHNGRADYVATSVMLLDCARLRHWNMRASFERMFRGKLDYDDWITLAGEPRGSIGALEPMWNDFDHLGPETRLLHNTRRRTQPWKTGLPIDFTNRVPLIGHLLPGAGIRLPGRYRRHPDPRQEALFFALLAECLDCGEVSEDDLAREMAAGNLRHDAFALLRAATAVDKVLAGLGPRLAPASDDTPRPERKHEGHGGSRGHRRSLLGR